MITAVPRGAVVADGFVWPEGTVSMRRRGPVRTTVEAASLTDIQTIHGHDGATRVVMAGLPKGADLGVGHSRG
ncbi:hypothetical protein [Nocardia testacea]|uniref:hypothetical protein n=1 Tax=Nocardia testacea TaxID=248551 RepID=UPI003A8ADC7A